MTHLAGADTVLPGVLVPVSLVERPAAFGGSRQGEMLAGDLVFRFGRASGLIPLSTMSARIVLPRFTDPHVHLDKCHTIGRLADVGGDLAAAIAAQRIDRQLWTAEDIRSRASRGLEELEDAGCGTVRTHVDWGSETDPGSVPLAWEIIGELAHEGTIALQRAALTTMPVMAEAGAAEQVARRIARDGGVLGCFVYGQPERAEGIANLFRVADRFGLALDFHVDEGLEPGLDGVEMIADMALETGFKGPVLIGHACALMNLESDDLRRVIGKLARAGIAVAALPYTNLYLQGRRDGTPDRRGLTRLHELRAGGVTVVLGADNVCDAFCPVGNHDPRQTLSLGIIAAHLDPPLGDLLPMVTTDARRALGLSPNTVDGAAIDDLLVFDATSIADVIGGGPARPLASILQDCVT